MSKTEDNHAEKNAEAVLENIKNMIERTAHARECSDDDCTEGAKGGDYWQDRDGYHDEESAQQAIDEHPLSVQIKNGWYTPGEDSDPEEFEILISTGGPACRIIGALDGNSQPERPRLQHQDWGTPWIERITTGDDQAALLAYCQTFYFGE